MLQLLGKSEDGLRGVKLSLETRKWGFKYAAKLQVINTNTVSTIIVKAGDAASEVRLLVALKMKSFARLK